MLVADYHNHPQAHRTDLPYSLKTLEPWAKRAVELGLKDLAFTDHDRYKDGVSFEEIENLRALYPQVKFRAGIELDNDPETSAEGRKWVEKNWDNLDFVLGSVHFVKDFAFDHPHYIAEYDKYDINDLYKEYYKNIQQIAKSGLVDSMAHLDLIKIFKFFPTENLDELYSETLDVIKDADLSIEISTAGIRKPIGNIYPDNKIIEMAKSKDISFTIAGDAHAAHDLSHNYDKLEKLLRDLDIQEVAIYHKHQKTLVNPFV
ncbi:MAG: histidinol-phosphatase HisJ family protein [Candidatus Caenarcaniphilales bacterium]|jgi:histidinol-phosphatase (PHP family)|nr:histidinol-phosphatase HisJ family protein [Candidatus Caenarcaniphilales bacterium]